MDREVMRKRLEICKTCPYRELKFLSPAKCAVCGCVIKIKAALENESCPIDKW